jgi:hypothetical protein
MNPTATIAPKQRRQRRKPQRFVRLVLAPSATETGVIRLTVGKASQDYLLTPIPSDYGRAFRVVKLGIDAKGDYAVNVDGAKRTCDCLGHLKHGHCKHGDSLAALIAAGKL